MERTIGVDMTRFSVVHFENDYIFQISLMSTLRSELHGTTRDDNGSRRV